VLQYHPILLSRTLVGDARQRESRPFLPRGSKPLNRYISNINQKTPSMRRPHQPLFARLRPRTDFDGGVEFRGLLDGNICRLCASQEFCQPILQRACLRRGRLRLEFGIGAESSYLRAEPSSLLMEYEPLVAENRARSDAGLAGGDLLALAYAAATHVDEPALAMDGQARRRDRSDLAEL
jgi:hypothetical protein